MKQRRRPILAYGPIIDFNDIFPDDGNDIFPDDGFSFGSSLPPVSAASTGSSGSTSASTPARRAEVPDINAPDAWALRQGVNCVVQFSRDNAGKVELINGKTLADLTLRSIVEPVAGSKQPAAGETWVCLITDFRAGDSISLRPLKQRSMLVLPDDIWLDPVNAGLIQAGLDTPGLNVMLIGEHGCGKTTIAEAIAQAKQWQFRLIAGNTLKRYTQIFGQNVPTVIDGEQRFHYETSQFVDIMDEAAQQGPTTYMAFIDEINRVDEKGQDVLLGVVAGRRKVLHLPNGRIVTVPENLKFMAACNEGSGFSVTPSDAASKDRWLIVKIGYMPEAREISHCLRWQPDCPVDPLIKAVQVINHIRKNKNDIKLRLSKNVSTRCAELVAMLCALGTDLKTALFTAVAGQYTGFINDARSESGRVAAAIARQLAS